MIRAAGSAFVAALKRRPVVLNSATGFVLFATSDAFAQEVERHGVTRMMVFPCRKDWFYLADGPSFTTAEDHAMETPAFCWNRFMSAGMLGVFFGGFVYPFAYAKLDALWPGTKFRQVLSKSVTEIFTVGIFVNSVSMTMRGLLADRPWDDVRTHVAKEMPRVTFNDLRLWLPYNLVAFGLLPPYLRPTTTVLMESAWQAYISLRSHDYQKQGKITDRIDDAKTTTTARATTESLATAH